ncbi:MAG TPA: ParB/RepB/Spo0J family partition protein [Bacteroidia bacterium]|jgi:ParB family chromosome partitioning protein|nr:ParB/RepB/Spo0J family partition protein [Bacteroidia bacterium]
MKKSALGRGLDALLENKRTDITTKMAGENVPVANSINVLKISQIQTNPFQPRTHFDKDALNELSESIRQHGIIQPITVRKMGYDNYQLISGERRFRASQLAGLKEVPAYIRIANDQVMLEMALVENIQREDLDAIEIAISYKRLIDECNLTQEGLAEKVAKQRSTITNYLRLLKLPAEIQKGIRDKGISMGHARALINIEDGDLQLALFAKILEEGLSVRDIESLARGEKIKTRPVQKTKSIVSLEDKKIVEKLNKALALPVNLKRKKDGSGSVTLNFKNDTEFEKILSYFEVY